LVETGSSLAASVAAATNAAPVDAASIEPEVDPSLAANTNAKSKEATMADANDTESDSSDDKFCSAAEEERPPMMEKPLSKDAKWTSGSSQTQWKLRSTQPWTFKGSGPK
jgi:hypothetical protein